MNVERTIIMTTTVATGLAKAHNQSGDKLPLAQVAVRWELGADALTGGIMFLKVSPFELTTWRAASEKSDFVLGTPPLLSILWVPDLIRR